ncbi:MAG: hypothetical protein CM15mP39_09030 [Synechococcus sp.]|nr:MAG: hypothetical protein CM15mP39_09030 [Synechococcus sp.]
MRAKPASLSELDRDSFLVDYLQIGRDADCSDCTKWSTQSE